MSSDDISVVLSDDRPPVDTLAVGVSEYGLAGLTAVDYLADQHSMREVGHLRTPGPPFTTPFENGTPRHHTRLYVDEAASFAVLVGERFVPPAQAGSLAEAIVTAGQKLDASNMTMLTGVPIAHGPDDHAPFYIATPAYQETYLDDTAIRPMGNGFLDGLSAELVTRGIDESFPTGVFTTPTHPQAPDAAAAIRLLTALKETHAIQIDTGPLEAFAANIEAHYQALAERLDAADTDLLPDDRMYM
ncbi:proteasome assembly chaperone family protein [Haloarcula hispanica]|uniref:Proteasome assembly chaperone family protein n=1 Tax=Haloarcula hispanica TaxID=51589 RepID=A0A5J5LHE2_HALHI|nr:PAC2 family protein [Haloarcula hispanica]KAA9409357.1 proteasome assembly chaperone family protein [Haloarcula hispanica]